MKLRQGPTLAPVIAVLTAILMAALCSLMLYQGLSNSSPSSFLAAACALILMIFAVRWAMRKPGDVPMARPANPLRQALTCGVAATLAGGLAMYQDHEALWHAPVAGFSAAVVLFFWFRSRSEA